jgi:hypothetical protein
LDLVDEERIALVKAREDENPVSQKRTATRKTRADTAEEELVCNNLIPDAATVHNEEEEKSEE